ncbi:DODA-type extradiol aromatic ring-opening family dioxygenase [Thalassolituus sp. UBA3500]|uniref:DODA-type extradiol aromatic ring-opening family dioxygenase n=1 Tax=Thalassolituus sp. UBA3500 TaxID=1947664 RepID=UPI000C0DD211|nr:class III extradiol ring-cleavage dioxygenase [Thalassolituus sp. UBA3500]MBN57306.1 dioxygenase [Oceanospirillaceae bacterium]|tara:strand:+ start:1902 stop:2702 length:801 start_codon:yes stop_codon:yes gene_type:complete
MRKINTVFISHGGGPLPVLGDPGHAEMISTLKKLAEELPRPKAILVISAHWEANHPTVTSASKPGMMYDYEGFPDEAYQLQYPSPGEPELADKVVSALMDAGIAAESSPERPYDHGLYTPLMLMYPEADIPAIQLSLVKGLNPDEHLRIGEALQGLDYDDLLIIGSGFSFHNMRAFFIPESPDMHAANAAFQNWLEETCMSKELPEEERRKRLQHWAEAPSARYCHPREEHLLPLHVCYGIAGRAADEYIATTILGKASGMYAWTA